MLNSGLSSVGRGELDLDRARLGNYVILAAVLITKSVTANADGNLPAWDKKWNILANNWLTEDASTEDVTDGSVW